MTFRDLGNGLGQFRDFVEVTGKRPNPNEGRYMVAQFFRVQLQSIASQDASFLQPKNPFFYGRARHPDLTCELRDGGRGDFFQEDAITPNFCDQS